MKNKLGLCAFLLCLTASAMGDRQVSDDDPWTSTELLAPATLAAHLKTFDPRLHIVYVGQRKAYKGIHIPRAVFAGPITNAKGQEPLTEALKDIPHDAEITIYCGCKPFVVCPHIRPGYRMLKQMGFLHLKVLKLNTGFDTDWAEKGYPAEIASR